MYLRDRQLFLTVVLSLLWAIIGTIQTICLVGIVPLYFEMGNIDSQTMEKTKDLRSKAHSAQLTPSPLQLKTHPILTNRQRP